MFPRGHRRAEKSVSGAERWALNRRGGGREQEVGGHRKSAQDNGNIDVLCTFLVASGPTLPTTQQAKRAHLAGERVELKGGEVGERERGVRDKK